jgi:hypothetical protein
MEFQDTTLRAGMASKRRRGRQVAPAAPEHGEQRIQGDDVPLRHGVENAARRGHIARAAEGADALVIAEEVASGDGGGAGASGRHGHCQRRLRLASRLCYPESETAVWGLVCQGHGSAEDPFPCYLI